MMDFELILRLFLAGLLGAVIGIEREFRSKEAGCRTHFMVALGSALIMVVSRYGFTNFAGVAGYQLDPARLAAQVVSGIGFIGAGTIIFQRPIVRGLTTAAGIWATCGIGLAVGAGLYMLGIVATVLALVGLESLTFIFRHTGMHSIIVEFSTTDPEALKRIVGPALAESRRVTSYEMKESVKDTHPVYDVRMVVRVRSVAEESAWLSRLMNDESLVIRRVE